MTIFRIEPSTACQLIENLIADKVMPAEKTAREALALDMRSKEGDAHAVKEFPPPPKRQQE